MTSQFPPGAKQPIKQRGAPAMQQLLGGIAERVKQRGEEMQGQEPQEDLNILPFPVKQEICEKWIQWRWEPCNYVRIYAILYTQNQTRDTDGKGPTSIPKGFFEVQFSTDHKYEDDVIMSFSSEEAKAIGLSMTSASNWINVWKEHAGMFIERDLLGEFAPAPNE